MKPKPLYFKNDFIYLQFTIVAYGQIGILVGIMSNLPWFELPNPLHIGYTQKYRNLKSKMADRKCPWPKLTKAHGEPMLGVQLAKAHGKHMVNTWAM